MFRFLFFIIVSTSLLYANYTLKARYFFTDNQVYAKDLFPSLEQNFLLFSIPKNKTVIKISTQKIQALFQQKGLRVQSNNKSVVSFEKRSLIDTSFLEDDLQERFLEKHPFLNIQTVKVRSKNYIKALPQYYKIQLKRNALSRSEGSFFIQADTKRFFFTYEVDASFLAYQTTKRLKKGTVLTKENTEVVIANFSKLFHAPLQNIKEMQSKQSIKAGTVLTQKIVENIPAVKKKNLVRVKLRNGNILIEFSAIALKNGRIGDIIPIQKSDGTKLRARVIAKGEVEVI